MRMPHDERFTQLVDGLTTCDNLMAHHQVDSHARPIKLLKDIVVKVLDDMYPGWDKLVEKRDGIYQVVYVDTPATDADVMAYAVDQGAYTDAPLQDEPFFSDDDTYAAVTGVQVDTTPPQVDEVASKGKARKSK